MCRKVTIYSFKSEWVVVVVLNSRFLLGICHLHNWTLVSVLGRQEEAAAFMLFLTNFQPWHRFTMCLNAQHFSWIPLCCDVLLQKILQSSTKRIKILNWFFWIEQYATERIPYFRLVTTQIQISKCVYFNWEFRNLV